MLTFRFLKRPGTRTIKGIISLYSLQGWWDKKDTLKLAAAIIKNSHCFLAVTEKDRVIGIGRAISDGVSDAYLQDIAVLEGYRGRGIGAKIVAALKERLDHDGIKWVGLVAQDDSSAFYKKLGFKIIKKAEPMMLKSNHV